MKNKLLVIAMQRKIDKISKIDIKRMSKFDRKSAFVDDLKNLYRKTVGINVELNLVLKNKKMYYGPEKDGEVYEHEEDIVQLEETKTGRFIELKLTTSYFNCCVKFVSSNIEDLDIKTSFDAIKEEYDARLTYEIRKMMKNLFGNTYVKLFKNYRKKVLENETLCVAAEMNKQYQNLQNKCDYDINKVVDM